MAARTLKCGSATVHLSAREFDLLALLASAGQSVVTKDDMIRSLWEQPDVSESAITQAVFRLRKILAAHDPRVSYIISAHGRGYSFARQAHYEQPSVDVTGTAFRRYRQALSCRASTAPRALNNSIRMLELALEQEPYHLEALIAIGEMYVTAAQLLFGDPYFALQRAHLYITRALRIEPRSCEASAVRSTILLFSESNIAGALDTASSALALDPDSARAQNAMVWTLIAKNHFQDAIAYAKRLLRACPTSPDSTALLGIASYYAGSFEEGLVTLHDALDLDAANGYAQNYAVRSLCAMERYNDAVALLRRLEKTNSFTPYPVAFEAYIAGRRNTLSKHRRDKVTRELADHSILKGLVSIGCGDMRDAEEHLRAATDKMEPGVVLVPIDPLFRNFGNAGRETSPHRARSIA